RSPATSGTVAGSANETSMSTAGGPTAAGGRSRTTMTLRCVDHSLDRSLCRMVRGDCARSGRGRGGASKMTGPWPSWADSASDRGVGVLGGRLPASGPSQTRRGGAYRRGRASPGRRPARRREFVLRGRKLGAADTRDGVERVPRGIVQRGVGSPVVERPEVFVLGEPEVAESRVAWPLREIARVAEGGKRERVGRGQRRGGSRFDLAPAVRDAHTLRDAGAGGLSGG